MRALLVVALPLVACSTDDPKPCPTQVLSDITHVGGVIVPGRELIGVSWQRRFGMNQPEVHGQIVSPDGTLSPEIQLGLDHHGTSGSTTILWHRNADAVNGCTDVQPFSVTLQRGGAVMHVDVATVSRGRWVTFDGQRYQLFWYTAANEVAHQALSEDGILGPVHTLGQGTPFTCVDAASDRAGLTFVRWADDGYIIDTATGALRLVFDGAPNGGYHRTFYFAGEFHVRAGDDLYSVSPTSTGAFVKRRFTGELGNPQSFYPTDSTMFVRYIDGRILEVDASLAIVRRLTAPPSEIGTFGTDLVRFERVDGNLETLDPGRLLLIRQAATEVWRDELAVDSPLHIVEVCEDIAL